MPFINRVRLPIEARRPQFVDEREVFDKSNGTTVVLSNVVRKEYQLVTDYLPEKLHERIKIALSHDTVNIEGEKYIGGIVQQGGYEISWPDFPGYPVAPAEVTVRVNGFAARNTNCGTCAEYSQVETEDDDIGTIGEDETVAVAILYNDAICCSPFEISVVTFNTTYLDSANVVDNTLVIHTKTGIPTQNSVILATYRVTCENGTYDEANVVANVEGSIEECLSPTGVVVVLITGTTATVRWNNPSPEPDCGYIWNLYLASDLGSPVQSGTHAAQPVVNVLSLETLTPSTNYVIQVASDCCEGSASPFVSRSFTTNPPEESEICGQYEVTFNDSCADPSHYGELQYLNCSDGYSNLTIFFGSPQILCLKQTSPGNPVYYDITGTNAPFDCLVGFTANYLGPC